MMYASSGPLKCFESDDGEHKRVTCPHKKCNEVVEPGIGSMATNIEAECDAESSVLNNIEQYIQPEKKAQVDVENLGTSQPAG